MNSLNKKLVAKVGDNVWYLNMNNYLESHDENCVFFDEIRQGKVTCIKGATDSKISIEIADIDGKAFSGVQEIFFTDFNVCLKVYIQVTGKIFGKDKKDWYQEYMKIAESLISYSCELHVPYSLGEKTNVIYKKNEYVGDVFGVKFSFSDGSVRPWTKAVHLQVNIPEIHINTTFLKQDCIIV